MTAADGPRRPAVRGPRGAAPGDVVVAEGSRWTVEAIDLASRQAVCRLIGGSQSVRRFRARRIVAVEKAPKP